MTADRYKGYDLARDLERFASRNGFTAPPAYYIVGYFSLKDADGNSVYSDEAHLWCESCGEALMNKAKALLPQEEADDLMLCPTDADGEDTCPHCMECGETLAGSVSSYCVGEEVQHYQDNPIAIDATINPRQAVEIAMICYSAPDDPEVLAIGNAALGAIARMEAAQ